MLPEITEVRTNSSTSQFLWKIEKGTMPDMEEMFRKYFTRNSAVFLATIFLTVVNSNISLMPRIP